METRPKERTPREMGRAILKGYHGSGGPIYDRRFDNRCETPRGSPRLLKGVRVKVLFKRSPKQIHSWRIVRAFIPTVKSQQPSVGSSNHTFNPVQRGVEQLPACLS